MIERAVVTGGAGVIGGVLVEQLADRGVAVLSVDRRRPRTRELRGVEHLQAELVDVAPEVFRSFDPTHVFHLAAGFERSEESPEFWQENQRDNIDASARVLRASLECRRLRGYVFASSYLVYDPTLYLGSSEAVEHALHEEDRLDPRNVCGAAKLLHERELALVAQGQFATIAARIFRVYGRGSRDVVSRWIRAGLDGAHVETFDVAGAFDYVFADDVAAGLLRLAESGASGVVNLGTGRPRLVSDVLKIVQAEVEGLRVHDGARGHALESSAADVGRLASLTGWIPPTDLERGIADIAAYERTQRDHVSPDFRTHPRPPVRILLPSAGNKVPLVRSLQRALRGLPVEGDVIAADLDPECLTRLVADSFLDAPRIDQLDEDGLVDWVVRTGCQLVVPSRDAELSRWSATRDALARRGIHVAVAPEGALDVCLDKVRFAAWARERNLSAIATSTDLDSIASSRLVVKERHGSGSRNVFVDVDRTTAAAVAGSLATPIYQAFVPGSELSADFFVDEQGRARGPVVRERRRVVGGESVDTRVVETPAIMRDLVAQLTDDLSYRGPGCAQGIVQPDGEVQLLEVNARIGGASEASVRAGLNLPELLVLEALHERLPDEPPYHPVHLYRLPVDLWFPE